MSEATNGVGDAAATAGGGRAAVLCAVGSCLPPRVVAGEEVGTRLGADGEWTVRRAGIRRRHVVEPGVSTEDLAVAAGADALRRGGVPVGAVILATCTPDRPIPATAPGVAVRLGLGNVPAVDVNAGCAGFVHALALADGWLRAGIADRVLVVGADTMSAVCDPFDRATAPLFGDGAGAVVLRAGRAGEAGALGPFDLGSDGSGTDLLYVPGRARPGTGGAAGEGAYLRVNGREVFRSGVRRLVSSCRAACARAGWEPGEVDHLAAHQADSRLLAAVAYDLGLPADRCLADLAGVGDTGAASVPLLLARAVAAACLAAGQRVLISAFGAGLAWGSTTLTWPDLPRG